MNPANGNEAGDNIRMEAHAQDSSHIYQVGSGTQNNIQHVYYGESREGLAQLRPFDLPNLRLWIDRISTDYKQIISDKQPQHTGKENAKHLAQLDALRQAVDESPRRSGDKDSLRRLMAGGIAQYLSRANQLPVGQLPEHLIMDVTLFALWPVLEAPRLPRSWQQDLAELTSPRIAAIMAEAWDAKATGHAVSIEALARFLAARPIANAVLNLFDDLGDPRRGGAALTAIAIACNLPQPPLGGGAKAIAAWISATLAGVAVGAAACDIETRIDEVLELGFDHDAVGGHGGRQHGGSGAMEHLLEEFLHLF